MEVVIDYEYLSGAHGEAVLEEVSVAAENVIDTFRFYPLLHETPQFPYVRSELGRWTYPLLVTTPSPNKGHD